MIRIAIVGAGISGLAAAYALEQQDWGGTPPSIDLFEARDAIGGVIRTARWHEAVVEMGPDSMVDKPGGVVDLCRQLGLQSQLLPVNAEAKPPLWLRGDGWHDFPSTEVRSYTLDGGLELLPATLGDRLRHTAVYTQFRVVKVTRRGMEWFVDGSRVVAGPYHALIMAVPAWEVARIMDSEMPWLKDVQYHPRAVVGAVYAKGSFGSSGLINHTGFMVSPETGYGLTACTWLNVKWPYRSSDDVVLARTFWGPPGPDPQHWTDQEILQQHERALTSIVESHPAPLWTTLSRYEAAIPSMPPGFVAGTRRMAMDGQPYWSLLGPYLEGPGLSDCVRLAFEEADHLVGWLRTSTQV